VQARFWFTGCFFFSLSDNLVAITAGGREVKKAFDKPLTENSACCETYFWVLNQYCCVLLLSP